EAARAGARYAMVQGYRAGQNRVTAADPPANEANVATTVKANAPALDPTRLTIASTCADGSNGPTHPVTVRGSYKDGPLLGGLRGLSINVNGSTTMLITY